MPLNFLPIVERELRVAARRERTYSIRVLVGLAALLLGAWGILASGLFGGGLSTQIGQAVFHLLIGVAVIWCGLAGAVLTADCLSREKCEGTLGFLFLADLIALGRVGLWEGLRWQSARQAFSRTVSLILVLPWITLWVLVTATAFLSFSSAGNPPTWLRWWAERPAEFFGTLWLTISLAFAGGFGWWARRQLLQHFRREVARQFQPVRRPWWARPLFAEETPTVR